MTNKTYLEKLDIRNAIDIATKWWRSEIVKGFRTNEIPVDLGIKLSKFEKLLNDSIINHFNTGSSARYMFLSDNTSSKLKEALDESGLDKAVLPQTIMRLDSETGEVKIKENGGLYSDVNKLEDNITSPAIRCSNKNKSCLSKPIAS